MQNEKVQKEDLKQRTKKFALALIKLYATLPKCYEAQIIGKQILRAGTSVGANYREGCRARSSQEFAAKLGICMQELEETAYWFELLSESGLVTPEEVKEGSNETDELIAIFVSSLNTVRKR
jgi:four helix bundle protein